MKKPSGRTYILCGAILLAAAAFLVARFAPSGGDGGSLPNASAKAGAISARVVAADGKRVSMAYAVGEPIVETKDGKTIVRLNGAWQKDGLPVRTSRVLLPAGRALANIQVRPGRKVELPGAYALDAKSGPLFQETAVMQRRGTTEIALNLRPVEYDAATGRLSYTESFEIDVETEPASAAGLPVREDSAVPLAGVSDNPETISTYSSGAVSAPAGGGTIVTAAGVAAPMASALPCDPAASFQYVIVTNAAMKASTIQPNLLSLVAHKQSRGLTATIVTVEEIYAAYPGRDNPEKIRNFVKDAYAKWETDFVLLAGDVNIIPIRSVRNSHAYTDAYYGCLDGSWDGNGNNTFAEDTDGERSGRKQLPLDLVMDVYVGRASAENATEMSNFVFKTLAFENLPADDPARFGSLLIGKDGGGLPSLEYGSDTGGYATKGFNTNPLMKTDRLYDHEAPWTAPELIAKMNSNRYTLMNGIGHGSATGCFYIMRQNYAQIVNTKPFFLYANSCDCGNFQYDCVQEWLTTSTRGGAFAAVMHVYLTGLSDDYARQFWDAHLSRMVENLGALHAEAIRGLYLENGYTEHIFDTALLGDPETRILTWAPTARPVVRSASASDAAGNADGLVNPGETATVSAILANAGKTAATGVTATLSCADPYVSVTDAAAAYPDLPPAGIDRSPLDTFAISVSPSCPTPRTVAMNLSIRGNGGTAWTDSFPLTVWTSSVIAGKVTLDGAAKSGATVTCEGPSGKKTFTTAKSGAYSFAVGNGTHRLQALLGDKVSTSDVRTIAAPPGNAALNFEYKTVTIQGTVTNAATGAKLANVQISLAGPNVGKMATTNSYGAYKFDKAIFGYSQYVTLTTAPAGYVREIKLFSAPPQPSGAVNFALQPIVAGKSAPYANFMVTDAGTTSRPAAFDTRYSSDSDGTIVRYDWTFGDGLTTSSTTGNMTHQYAKAGLYTALLVVTDNAGLKGYTTRDFTVAEGSVTPPPPPALAVTASGSPTSGTAPLSVVFGATATGGTGTYSYAWNFGDGQTGTGATPTHVYTANGTYDCVVTASDGTPTATAHVAVTVSATPPPPPPPPSGSATFTVAASADDGRERSSDGQVSLTGAGQSIGTTNTHLAFRFTGVSIPKGAAVTSAVLQFEAYSDSNRGATGQFSIVFAAEDAGNSAALAATAYNLSSRAKAAPIVALKPAAWTNGTWVDSPNLSALVQAVVNRADWASGNALTLFIAKAADSTEYRTIGQADGGFRTRLVVTWE